MASHVVRYEFTIRGEGVAFEETNRCLWDRTKLRGSHHRCANCLVPLKKGERAWRPLSEGGGTIRTERMCDPCVRDFAT